jgi:hypothetical protein
MLKQSGLLRGWPSWLALYGPSPNGARLEISVGLSCRRNRVLRPQGAPSGLPRGAAGALNYQLDAAISHDFLYRVGERGCDLHANVSIRLHASDAAVGEFHFKDDSAFTAIVVEQPVEPLESLVVN